MTTKMRALWATSLLLAVTAAFSGWAGDREAAETEFKATSVVLAGSLDQVVLAITRAFANGAYHGKRFFAPPFDFVVTGRVRTAVPLTNTWDLCVPDQGWLPLTLVPSGRLMVAYDEDFSIKAEAVSAGSTRVSIRSQGSSVTEDKYDRSPHLALVLRERYHPPIPSETTNLLMRIERQLREIRAGRTNALPATLDTSPGFYREFWTTMDVKEQHDSRNWKKMVDAWKAMQAVQTTTNSAGAVMNGVR